MNKQPPQTQLLTWNRAVTYPAVNVTEILDMSVRRTKQLEMLVDELCAVNTPEPDPVAKFYTKIWKEFHAYGRDPEPRRIIEKNAQRYLDAHPEILDELDDRDRLTPNPDERSKQPDETYLVYGFKFEDNRE